MYVKQVELLDVQLVYITMKSRMEFKARIYISV